MSEIVTETVSLSDLNPAEYNPRKITNMQYRMLVKSIKAHGILEPFVVNRRENELIIVAGHQRYKAAQELDILQVPANIIEVDEATEKALNISLNKLGGDFDKDKLQEVIKDIIEVPTIDVELTGFSSMEVQKMLAIPTESVEGEYPITPYFSEKYDYVIIMTKNEIDRSYLFNALGVQQEKSYKSTAIGLGHVVDFDKFKDLWEGNQKGNKVDTGFPDISGPAV